MVSYKLSIFIKPASFVYNHNYQHFHHSSPRPLPVFHIAYTDETDESHLLFKLAYIPNYHISNPFAFLIITAGPVVLSFPPAPTSPGIT